MPDAWTDMLKVGVQVDAIYLIPSVAFWACSASVDLTSSCYSKCTKTERVSASKSGGSVIHEDIAVLVTILVSLEGFAIFRVWLVSTSILSYQSIYIKKEIITNARIASTLFQFVKLTMIIGLFVL